MRGDKVGIRDISKLLSGARGAGDLAFGDYRRKTIRQRDGSILFRSSEPFRR